MSIAEVKGAFISEVDKVTPRGDSASASGIFTTMGVKVTVVLDEIIESLRILYADKIVL